MSDPGHLAPFEPAARRLRRSWKQRILLTVGGSVAVFALLGAAFVGFLLVQLNSIERFSDLDIDAAPAGEPRNFLLVGSDSRGDAALEHGVDGQRSDTIMIVRVDPQEEQAAVLSLPRDLVVSIADTGEVTRINSAYARGTPEEGRQVLIDTIRQNFAIEINHFIELKFEGFARLVDAVGGVPLFFETPVRDTHSGLVQNQTGCVSLDGEQALAFVRSRFFQQRTPNGWEYDPTADLGRITRQQIFLREAVSRTVSAVKSNPLKITQLIDIGVDAVALDDQLGLGDIRDLADRFSDFSTDKLQTYSLPIVERGDGATVALDEQKAEPILNVFRGLDPGELSPGVIQVRVLNGTGKDGQANDVAGALEVIGFDVVEATDAPTPHERTTIYHRPDEEALAVRVMRHVTGGAELVVSEDVPSGQVEFVTGNDLTTLHDQPTPLEQVTTTTEAPGGGGEDNGGQPADDAPSSTTTTEPPTTTTTLTPTTSTVIGDAVGAVPEGADCKD
jgi:LCP family protein required for cell wall assembly